MLSIGIKIRNQECLQNVKEEFLCLAWLFLICFLLQNRPYSLKIWKTWNWRKLVNNIETKIIKCTHFTESVRTLLTVKWQMYTSVFSPKNQFFMCKLDQIADASNCHVPLNETCLISQLFGKNKKNVAFVRLIWRHFYHWGLCMATLWTTQSTHELSHCDLRLR